MTRKRQVPAEVEIEAALKTLYGDGVADVTPEGYREAIRNLRELDPTKARRAERALKPLLERRIFLRRARPWQGCSQGTKVRLALLPDNPHFQQDVQTIRSILAIPVGQLSAPQNHPLWAELGPYVPDPADLAQAIQLQLAHRWLYAHQVAALARELPPDPEAPQLTQWETPVDHLTPVLRAAAQASGRVDLTAETIPAWLRRPASDSEAPGGPALPVDWAVSRLLGRHRLPRHLANRVVLYVLTLNRRWIEGLEPLEVNILQGPEAPDPEVFAVEVKGLDEFVTKEDWVLIWEKVVRPRQEELWDQRGMKPQGKVGPERQRLERVLPLYIKKVGKSLSDPQVFDLLEAGELDQETVRRGLRELESLLAPQE